MVQGIPERDYHGEAQALYDGVRKLVRFTRDPHGVELLSSPWQVLRRKSADCDEMVILYCALAEAIGFETAFETVKASRAHPDQFSHVYALIRIPHTGWMPVDPSQPMGIGWRPPAAWGHRAWLSSGKEIDVNTAGLGFIPKNYYEPDPTADMGGKLKLKVGHMADAIPVRTVAKAAVKKLKRARAEAAETSPGRAIGHDWRLSYMKDKVWPPAVNRMIKEAVVSPVAWSGMRLKRDTMSALKAAAVTTPERIYKDPKYQAAFWDALERIREKKTELAEHMDVQTTGMGQVPMPGETVDIAPSAGDIRTADKLAREQSGAPPLTITERVSQVPGTVFLVAANVGMRFLGRRR